MKIKVSDFIKAYKSTLQVMSTHSISVSDVKYVELFEEYMKMVGEGCKIAHVTRSLADKYNVGERTVYRVVDKFSGEVFI